MEREELVGLNFTDGAKRTLDHIIDRALDRGMIFGELTEATAGMLALLSILRWEQKIALVAVERVATDIDRLARELDIAISDVGQSTKHEGGPQFEAMSDGSRRIVMDIDSPRRTLLDLAERQSRTLGHTWVGTEHLLLAAVESACPRLQELLARHEIEYVRLRQSVLDLLSEAMGGSHPRTGRLD